MKLRRMICLLLVLCMCAAWVPKAYAAEDRAMGTAGIETKQDPTPVTPLDRTDPPTAFGIDVSHHQGTIDWDTVASQIDFAIIRCGYGNDTTSQDDRQWFRNVQECTRLGIPFGVYIYSYAFTEAEALSEANHVLRLIQGYQPTLPIYYDLEDASILENCSATQILNIARTFCEKIEAAGYRAGVYANHNWWTNYLTSAEYDRWDRWIARYASAPGYSKDYSIWQYTSSGSINGISGNVDLNHWYGAFPPSGTSSGSPANLGDVFTAPILNKQHWKIIENNDGIVQTANEVGKANQLWKFERQSDGSYKISSCQDGRCLDVANASSASGAQVWVVDSNDTNAQRWYIYEESGGYVLKAKCTDCVLDLPNNDPTNGNRLQMYTKNGTGAQIWAIYRGEECVLKGPTLSVNAGNSSSATTFTWNDVYGERGYDLKIWKDTLWEGDAYYIEWGATSGHSVVLPAGTYHAYVDAVNHFECKMSNVVTFTVNAGTYTISYHANGGSGAPGNQTKTHGTNLTLSTTVPTRFGYNFLGWATSSTATSPSYYSGGTYSKNASATLYAVWGTPSELSGAYSGFGRTPTINNGGAGVYYKFIPNATTNYRIYGTGDVDTVLYLYDASGNQLAYNDDGGSNRQFKLEYSFTKDTTYYLYVKFYSSSQTGALPFQVDKRYSIRYDANGGSGAPGTQYKYNSESVTLSSTVPTGSSYTVTFHGNGGAVTQKTKDLTQSFSEWNTRSDGSGTSYAPGGTYSTNSNTTLYAQWDAPTLGTVPEPQREGYTFIGWYDSSEKDSYGFPTGTKYTSSTAVSGNMMLFAMWADASKLVYGDVDLDGTVSMADVTLANKYRLNKDTPAYSAEELLIRVDLNRDGEFTEEDITEMNKIRLNSLTQEDLARAYTGTAVSSYPKTSYTCGERLDISGLKLEIIFDTITSYEITEGLTVSGFDPYILGTQSLTVSFYQFSTTYTVTVSPAKYTISYNANGGTGAPTDHGGTAGEPLTLSSTVPTRFGYSFLGWSTSSNATSASYLPGESFTPSGNTTLYAVWQSAATIPSNVTSSSFSNTVSFAYGYWYYSFTPSFSGKVRFESTGNQDPRIFLYDASGTQLDSNDDGGEGNNFQLTYSVTSGTTYYAKVKMFDKITGSIHFTVKRAYDVAYDANGGSGAPGSQTVCHGEILTVSTAVPTRSGYTFLGWASRRNATEPEFLPGHSYTLNDKLTLYAVWAANCDNGHSYTYEVTKVPTTSATGTLTGTCSRCSGTTTVTLPKLNTTDYSHSITKAATCTTSGTGRYTWKTTTYGSFSFDVSIPALGHNFVNGVCTRCGAKDPNASGSEVASGWSGDTQWTLTDDGVLRFYGSGNMKNYGYNGGQPWTSYKNQITSIIVEKGVTAIGEGAFKDLTNLESVALPSGGLTKIGEAAFYGCTALRAITIPEGIYTIWSYTFKNCTRLREVNLPDSLIKIDQGAFENCTSLPYIYFPTDVEIIGSWSFKGCTGLKEADMTWTDATKIREGAFKNCSSLTTIHLPVNIQVLGDSCFYGIGATSFTVPDTVTSIEAWCFARAYSLKNLYFEGNAPTIGEGAFNKITLSAYYPRNNSTWTSAVRQNYGGTVTWKAN